MCKFRIRPGDRVEHEGCEWVVLRLTSEGVEGRYRSIRGRRGQWRDFRLHPDSWCELVADARGNGG